MGDIASVRSKTVYRLVFAAASIALVLFVANSYVTTATSANVQSEVAAEAAEPFAEREAVAPPTENVTVVTGQGFQPPEGFGSNQWADNALMAFAPDGRPLYYEAKYDAYQDVDPSPEGDRTVLFAASDLVNKSACGATAACQRDYIVRLNMTTGEREHLYSYVAPHRVNNKLHDVDRIDEHLVLAAGMAYDRLYIVNTTTDMIEWQWDAQQAFDLSGGGDYPADWTHVNDVEYLPEKGENGWIMASLRNQDQVVFVDRETGLVRNWTLGAENNYSVLYEQHNPDYIPEERGGPAVVVSDSHNNRIAEFQRENGTWNQTWQWADAGLSWPRDADRLPNGNTLVSDTNGERLLEVAPNGSVVWQLNVSSVYEAERLSTGDESARGASAKRLGLVSRVAATRDTGASVLDRFQAGVLGLVPEKVVNAVKFVLPLWIDFLDAVALGLLVGVLSVWALLELWWSSLRVSLRFPVGVRRER